MGCDIYSFTEVKQNGKWVEVEGSIPFDYRSYTTFSFLASVRSRENSPECIKEPCGLPKDSEYLNEIGDFNKTKLENIEDDWDYHSHTHILLEEFLNYNYDQIVFGGISLREHLMEGFFDEIRKLEKLGEPNEVRVVMYFCG